MKTKYYIINKSDNKAIHKSHADQVATHLLGKNTDNYIVLKTDDLGQRVIDWTYLKSNTHNHITALCEAY